MEQLVISFLIRPWKVNLLFHELQRIRMDVPFLSNHQKVVEGNKHSLMFQLVPEEREENIHNDLDQIILRSFHILF